MQKESRISRYTLFGAFGLALIEIPKHKQSNHQHKNQLNSHRA
jgi:hypothetical protein